MTYWRDGTQEVDFVVTHGKRIWAIEVKSSRTGKVAGLAYDNAYNVGNTIATVTQAILFMSAVKVEPSTMLVMAETGAVVSGARLKSAAVTETPAVSTMAVR